MAEAARLMRDFWWICWFEFRKSLRYWDLKFLLFWGIGLEEAARMIRFFGIFGGKWGEMVWKGGEKWDFWEGRKMGWKSFIFYKSLLGMGLGCFCGVRATMARRTRGEGGTHLPGMRQGGLAIFGTGGQKRA
jgi:hypothetical protein